jgi:prepilin-type N-terminal cleavage/methylation domain-containing protein
MHNSPHPPPAHCFRRCRQGGFTLIEILFSLWLFAILSLSMSSSLIFHMKTNSDNEIRAQAIQAAQRVLDQLRTKETTSLQSTGNQNTNVDIGGRTYAVNIAYCSNASLCTSSTIRHLKAEVTYGNRLRYKTETVFTQLK